jgi:hypothetical protein
MDRPEKIYLDEPIKLHGIEINHTKAGLEYLIEHFSTMLLVYENHKGISDEVKKHYIKKIEQYQQHIELYNKSA